MQHNNLNLTLKVWRQKDSKDSGRFETYEVKEISTEMSFLEMFDVLNERLISEGKATKEIAEELFISPRTVDHHRANISSKLDLKGKNALLTFALTNKTKI